MPIPDRAPLRLRRRWRCRFDEKTSTHCSRCAVTAHAWMAITAPTGMAISALQHNGFCCLR
jgi:hypothetical protein